MQRRWVIRLLGDDGTAVEGRLEVEQDEVVFRAGMQGAMVPAMVIGRDRIARVQPVDRGLAHRVELVLRDGSRIVLDNGLRPTADLVAALSGPAR